MATPGPEIYFGTLDATFSVDANGCTGYSIPLDLPPGTRGFAPALSLLYSSGTGNGVFGVGWSLAGLSSIVRTGQTPAQDGARRAIRYDEGDRFTLDTSRLVVVAGTYGAPGSSYRTEIDSYQYVGVVLEEGIDGPAEFVAKTKDGRVLEYGSASGRIFPAPGATVVRAWALDRVTDPVGNAYTIEYASDPQTGAYYPAKIAYTGNTTTDCRRSVTFVRETRSDVEPRFEVGFAVHPTQRIRAIATAVDDKTVTTYTLDYEQGAGTGRSRLTAITRSDAAGVPLTPTTFSYADIEQPGFALPEPAVSIGVGTVSPLDVGGRGHRDLLVTSADESGNLIVQLACALSDGSGYAAPTTIATSGLAAGGVVYPLDVDGDGFMEVLYVSTLETGALGFTIFTARSTGSGWTLEQGVPFAAGPDDLMSGGMLVPADVDGNGATELIACSADEDGRLCLEILSWDGATFVRGPALTSTLYWGGIPFAMDYDGDGALELVYALAGQDGVSLQLASFRADGGMLAVDVADLLPSDTDLIYGGSLLPVNLTGDQKDDLVYAYTANDGTLVLRACLSNGIGLLPQAPCITALEFTGAITPVSVRGSGIIDLLFAYPDANAMLALTHARYVGGSFQEPSPVSLGASPPPFTGALFAADVAGWGNSDLLYVTGDVSQSVARMAAPAAITDAIVTIRNGEGRIDTLAYSPMTLPATYRRTGVQDTLDPSGFVNATVRGATWALGSSATPGMATAVHVVDFARFVVCEHAVDDGRGNLGHYTYTYEDAQIDLDGRGWLGFAAVERADAEIGTTIRHEYVQAFPYTSLARIRSERRTSDGALMSRMTTDYDANEPDGIWRVTSRRTLTEGFTYGTLDVTESVARTFDALGNVATEIHEHSTFPSQYVFYGYLLDLDRPLSLLTSTKRTSDSDGLSVLSWSEADFDPATCLRRASRIWDDVARVWLESTFGYDAYGNETETRDATGAVTQTQYDDDYHTFVVSTTLPANEQGLELTVESTYDPASGGELTHTDANGVVLVATYDGLGRRIDEIGPDPAGTPYLLARHVYGQDRLGYFEEVRQAVTWSGLTHWERHYYDGLHREYRRESLADDGMSTIVVTWAYDTRDDIVAATLPAFDGAPAAAIARTYDPYRRVTSQVEPLDGSGTTTTTTTYPTVLHEVRTEAHGTPLARTTVLEYALCDGKRHLVRSTDAAGARTTYTYDAAARLTSAVDPDGVRNEVHFDTLNRQHRLEVSAQGAILWSRELDYRDTERRVRTGNGNGDCIEYFFDLRGRLVRKDVAASGGLVESTRFTYDLPEASYGLDRLCVVDLPNGDRDVYAFDAYGNHAYEQRTIGGETTVVQRSYTPLGLAEATTFPDGARSTVTYTVANRIRSLAFAAAEAPFQTHAEYSAFDASSRATHVLYGNGLGEQRPTNELGQIVSLTFAASSGTAMWQRNYVWDALRRLTAIGSPADPASAQRFGYDAVGRLVSSTGPYAPQTYGYSLGGNLIQKNDIAFAYRGHRVESGHINRTTVFEGSYDADGALLAATRNDVAATYLYDGEGRLLRAPGLVATYDAHGIRTRKTANDGTDTRYIAPDFETTRVGPTRQHTYYLLGPSGPAVQIGRLVEGPDPGIVAGVPAVGTRYLFKDQIGTTSLVTDGNGTVAASAMYLPYGEVVGKPPTGYRFGFTGRELDATSQLFYFDARYYDAFLGRFVTSDDQLAGDLGEADALNRYAYALNSPLVMVDPDGHFPWSILIDVGLVLAGIAIAALTDGAGAALLASTVTSAGTSGISYDTRNGTHDTDFAAWGKTVGVGAAFGVVSGAASEVIDAGTEAYKVGAAMREGIVDARAIAQQTIALRMVTMPLVSSGLNVAQTAATNAALGNSSSAADLGIAAATGAVLGVAKSAARGGIRYQRLVGDVQARLNRGARPLAAEMQRIIYRRLTLAVGNVAAPAAPPGIQLGAVVPVPVPAAAFAAPNPALR
ncbi:RHS repeat-associated protein [Mycobacterium sp. URHB0021]